MADTISTTLGGGMGKVAVSKGLLMGLAVTCAVTLLALMFFVGLAFGRKGLDAHREEAPIAAAAPQPSPVTNLSSTMNSQITPPVGTGDSTPVSVKSVAAAQTPTAIPSNVAAPATDPMGASVVAYFEATDHIQPGSLGGDAHDAQGMANEMASALAKGDTSGLDKMIQQSEVTRRRLAALSPPPPCAAYHRTSLASLDDGLEMMRSIKKAVDASDADALSQLTAQGNALRSRSEALEREEKAIRQHYGLLH